MSWWQTAAKIAAYGGAPFTGGATLAALPIINAFDSPAGAAAGTIGAAAGGAGAGRAQGRIDEAGIQQRQDQNMLERARLASLNTADLNRFNLDKATQDLANKKFGLEAPGMRAGNAVRGDILANAQDATIAPGTLGPNVHVPTISGGLRPSMFSDSTRQLGGLMSSQALAGQQAGDQFDPLTYQSPDPIPGLTPLPQSNGVDTFLNTAGVVGTGMDAFLQWLKRYQATKPPTSTPPFTTPGTTSGLLDPSTEGYGYTA